MEELDLFEKLFFLLSSDNELFKNIKLELREDGTLKTILMFVIGASFICSFLYYGIINRVSAIFSKNIHWFIYFFLSLLIAFGISYKFTNELTLFGSDTENYWINYNNEIIRKSSSLFWLTVVNALIYGFISNLIFTLLFRHKVISPFGFKTPKLTK